VFPPGTGAKLGATNVRKRLLAPAVKAANAVLGIVARSCCPST
jgi:hypothetical protein